MSGNAITISPLLPVTQSLEAVQLAPAKVENINLNFAVPNNIGLITAYNPIGNKIYIQSEPLSVHKPVDVILRPNPPLVRTNAHQFIQPKPNNAYVGNIQQLTNNDHSSIAKCEENKADEVVYQMTYPEDLNLKVVKRGRTKKKSLEKLELSVKVDKLPHSKTPRTRSGRIIKTPKHIEKDFEKILITNEPEIKTVKFSRVEDDKQENKDLKELEHHYRRKTISSQFRCSFCKKIYLGKRSMYKHLLKNPDHGPLPDNNNNNNFDVWNYLVDITQKCPSGRRGIKFCEELTNLLHNLQLLTNALFKSFISNATEKNTVQVDKVLGNAIGLLPGKYNFDENELYKDVTVLKLIQNNHFFAPKKTVPATIVEPKNVNTETSPPKKTVPAIVVEPNNANSETNPNTITDSDDKKKSKNALKNIDHLALPIETREGTNIGISSVDFQNSVTTIDAATTEQTSDIKDFKLIEPCSENFRPASTNSVENCNKLIEFNKIVDSSATKTLTFPQSLDTDFRNTTHTIKENYSQKSAMTKTDVDFKIQHSNTVGSYSKTINHPSDGSYKALDDNTLSLHSDLLSDNSLLALPNLRTTVDELMLSNVDTTSNLLDNSTSSDEVMNVDQFVNERFKKITEPDTDLKFNTSLNLDLPSLDLFQFHTS